MTPEDLKEHLTVFATAIVLLCRQVRRIDGARDIADQLSDSATSVSSNYRAACRARSHREFLSKLGIALEEADESVGWLDLIIRTGLSTDASTITLLKESQELLAILSASRRTAERRGGEGT
jgi:four helix bundle protein